MSEGYVRLFESILESSVWGEPPPTVKVWITMLLKADKHGRVLSTVPGLVRAAALPRARVEAALAVLQAPDPDSRTPNNEGRRVEVIEGGWRILNHQKYREFRTEKQKKTAERVRNFRDKQNESVTERYADDVTHGNAPYADGDAEADASADGTTKPTTTAEHTDFLAETLVALRIAPQKLTSWTALLEGMAEGSSGPGMRSVPWPTLHEAAVELSTAPGDISAHRYKKFVEKVLERQQPKNGRSPPRGDKTKRSLETLESWLDEKEPQTGVR